MFAEHLSPETFESCSYFALVGSTLNISKDTIFRISSDLKTSSANVSLDSWSLDTEALRGRIRMSKQTPPSSVQEDDTYPVHTLDDIKANRKFVSWTMLFNDVLDAEKLHNALSKLLEIGDWRKLGGRLRLKV